MLPRKYSFRKVTRYLKSLPSASESIMASRVGSETPTSSILSTSEAVNSHEPKSIPVFLPVGAAVSAKYRGAFCEALIESVAQDFKVRVQLKEKKALVTVEKNNVLSGNIEPNADVSVIVKNGEFASTNPQSATILKVSDLSVYTVVFDDGDKRTLKRTQLVMKGERHYKESETLDRLPLTNPEQFKQPVIDRSRRYQSSQEEDDEGEEESQRRRPGGLKNVVEEEGEVDDAADSEEEEEATTVPETNSQVDEEPAGYKKGKKTRPGSFAFRRKSSATLVPAAPATVATDEDDNATTLGTVAPITCDDGIDSNYRRLLGSVVMIDMPVSSKNDTSLLSTSTGDTSATSTGPKRRFTPGLVVLPSAQPSIDLKAVPVSTSDTAFLVKSFRDNRFYAVAQRFIKSLSRPKTVKMANQNPSLRTAFERALLWFDRRELPAIWNSDTDTLLGPNWKSGANSDDETEENTQSRSHRKKANRQRRRQRSPSTSSTEDASSGDYSNSSDSRSEFDEVISISEEVVSPPTKHKPRAPKNALRGRQHSRHPRKNSSSSSQVTVSGAAESNEGGVNNSNDDEEEGDDGDSDTSMNSDSQEYFEARDRWIATLYRFMDQRRTPINKAPSIANKDLDLYKLFRKVDRFGGFHRVSTQMKWPAVYSEMDLPPGFTAGPKSLQTAFKKYLLPIDELKRKLGTDLDEISFTLTRKSKAVTSATKTFVGGQKSSSKTNTSGEPKTASVKGDDIGNKANQRRMSAAKDEKLQQTAEVKIKSAAPSTNSNAPTSKVTPSSTASKKGEKKEKSSMGELSKSRLSRLSNTPEPLNRAPSDLSSKQRESAVGEKGEGHRSSAGIFFDQSPSTRSSPSRPTFDDEVYHSLEALQGSKSWLAGGYDTKMRYPVGSLVSVSYNGRAYQAKVLSHVNGQSFQGQPKQTAQESAEASSKSPKQCRYLVHYLGWNKRYNEVIPDSRILGLLDGVRRSPSCSNLDLTGQGMSTKKESTADTAESDAGEKHPKKKSSQQHYQQKQRAKHPLQQQQRSHQPAVRQSDTDSTTIPSLSNKKPNRTISPESVKPSTSSKRPSGNLAEDSQPVKKRRIQGEQNSAVGRVEQVHNTSKSSGSIVDAATSLTRSPKTLKKILKRDPVEIKPQPSVQTSTSASHGCSLEAATSTPLKAASVALSHWEAVSSSDDEASTNEKQASPVTNLLSVKADSLSSLSPPAKKIKVEGPPSKSSKAPGPSTSFSAVKSSKGSSASSGKGSTSLKTTSSAPRRTKPTTKPKRDEGASDEETTELNEPPQAPKLSIKKEEVEKKEKESGKKPAKKPKREPKKALDATISSSRLSVASISDADDNGENDSDEEDLPSATRDILPRLTRSQHKLILGDNPPGAQLLTATANPLPQPSAPQDSPAEEKKKDEEHQQQKADKTAEVSVKSEEKREESMELQESMKKTEKPVKKAIPVKKKREEERTKSPQNAPSKSPASSPRKIETQPVSSHPDSPVLSDGSDLTEPMRNSPVLDSIPIDPPIPRLTPLTSPDRDDQDISMPSVSSTSTDSSAIEDEADDMAEEDNKNASKSSLVQSPQRAAYSTRGRSTRGFGRGGFGGSTGRRRKGGLGGSAVGSNTAGNDDAESVDSSASSGFKSGRKVGRGGRRGGAANASMAAPTLRGTSPLSSPPEGRTRQSLDIPPPQPEIRRFGGPYFPIPDAESMNLSQLCTVIMYRMVQVAKSYKGAKDMIKAIDQRIAAESAATENAPSVGDSVPGSPAVATGGGGGRGGFAGPRRGGGGFRGGPRRRQLSVNQPDEE
ncbi:hypothetical protein Aperf_G00000018446 [Anoplocephala perfoliata]